MKKVLRNEFGLSRKAKAWIIAGILIFLGVTVVVYSRLYVDIEGLIMRESAEHRENISKLNADVAYRELGSRKALLESFAVNLSKGKITDIDKIVQQMAVYAERYGYYEMGIITTGGIFYTTDGDQIDVSQIEQYQGALGGKTRISQSFVPADKGEEMVNLVSVPVYCDGEMQYVLAAEFRSRELTDHLNIQSSKSGNYNFILDQNGKVMIFPEGDEDFVYLDLMEFIDGNADISPTEEGYSEFMYEGETYYVRYEKLDVHDWYLMTCLAKKEVFAGAKAILRKVLGGMGLLWTQMILMLVVFLFVSLRFQDRVQKTVFYDKLLNEKNGEFLQIYFRQLTGKERREMAFIALDIDKFKEFNYIYGNACGDRLLVYIDEILQKKLPDDAIFRYSGDHFIVIAKCADEEETERKIRSVTDQFAEDIDRHRIQPFDLSIGVRMLKEEDEDFGEVLSDALLAKNTVKGNQMQAFAFFDNTLRKKRVVFMEMESDFRQALKKGEFKVYYQPKYDMRTGKITGAEALVRWIKSDGDVLSPGLFIPCFEASRQIVILDEYMLESVCRQMKRMEEDGIQIRRVSVNLSRMHLKHPGIVNKIAQIIQETGIDPAYLALEITESALYEDAIPMKRIVERLHELGCQVDMDDYGTGVSSASSLADIRFDVLKMDKSFVDRIGDERMESVIRSTISLSDELGMSIIAEGVEDKVQAEMLTKWGCNYAQGYYYSRPVPEEEYREMLKRQ